MRAGGGQCLGPAGKIARDVLAADALPSFKALHFTPLQRNLMSNPSSSYSKFNPGSPSPSPPRITPRTALLLLAAILIALGAGAAIGYAVHDSQSCTPTPNPVPRRTTAPLSTFSASLVATGYAADRW